MKNKPYTVHIVAGPTASGKSSKALRLAQDLNGAIINCDSLQVYDGLALLTAQPSAEDREKAPHYLYGTRHPNDACSAGNWREDALPIIEELLKDGRTPIVVGGTGLYIKALIEGLSPIPDIPKDVRAAASALQKKLGNPGFYDELKKRDPVMAERFHPYHTARLVRAWEVLEATGKSLAEWQQEDREGPPAHWRFEIHKIMPSREEINERCDARFLQMMEMGALEEVEEFGQKIEHGNIHPNVPLTKALGFLSLLNYVKLIREGKADEKALNAAIARAQTETRQYAKRQMTWFRHQL